MQKCKIKLLDVVQEYILSSLVVVNQIFYMS